MGVFQDIWDTATPWRFSTSEWKDKIGDSSVGSPIHGLRAGYEATKLGSAWRLKQSIGRMKDGEDPFSSEGVKNTVNDQGNNVADMAKQNYPVLLSMLSGLGSAGSAGGGAAGGAGAGSVGGAGAAGAGAAAGETLAPVVVTGSSGGLGAGLAGAGIGGAAAASTGGSGSSVGDTLAPVEVTGQYVPEGIDMSGAYAGLGSGLSQYNTSSSDSNSNSDEKKFDWQKQLKSLGQGQQGQQQQQAPPPQMPHLQQTPSNFMTFDSQQPGLGRVAQTLQPKITPEQAQRRLLLDQSMLRMGFGQ